MKSRYLKEIVQQSEYLVCLLGKGISGKGIDNYRDSWQAYETELHYGYSPEELYSARFFSTRADKFYEFYKKEILGNIPKINPAFYSLRDLEEMDYLKCSITRQIYDVPRLAGCKRFINLHGSIYTNNKCPRCGREYEMSYLMNAPRVPLCEKCRVPIHPGICLLGEMVDNHTMSRAVSEVAKADVLLVVGNHLKSALTDQFVPYFSGRKLVVINPQEHYTDPRADLVINRPIQEVLGTLVEDLRK